MKQTICKWGRIFLSALLILILLSAESLAFAEDDALRTAPLLAGEDEDYVLPNGTPRAKANPKAYSASTLYSKYGAKKKKGLPIYKPASPQPLNVLITTASGHTKYYMESTDNLDDWVNDIINASQGLLRVVTAPKQADVMITILRKYNKVMYRSSSGKKVAVYNCTMTISAVMLSNTSLKISVTRKNIAPDSFRVSVGTTSYYESDPYFELSSFMTKILRWYGLDCKKGSKGAGAKRVQQALKARKLYTGKIDGTFNAKCEEALKKFQESIGNDPTGVVDRDTLVLLYYDEPASI